MEETLRFLDDAVRRARSTTSGCPTSPAGSQKSVDLAEAGGCGPPGHPAAAVQPAGPGHRVGDRPGLPGGRAGPAALVAAGRRLADRQVPARRGPGRGPGWGRSRTRHGEVEWRGHRSATGRWWTWCAGRRGQLGAAGRRWPRLVAARPAVTSVILGARTLAQLDDNLAAADQPLDAEETRLLDEASEPDTPDYRTGRRASRTAAAASTPTQPDPPHRRRPALPDGERGPT